MATRTENPHVYLLPVDDIVAYNEQDVFTNLSAGQMYDNANATAKLLALQHSTTCYEIARILLQLREKWAEEMRINVCTYVIVISIF